MSATRYDAINALAGRLALVGTVDPVLFASPVTRVITGGMATEGATLPYIAIERVTESYTRASSTKMYAKTMNVVFVYYAESWTAFAETGNIVHDVELTVGLDRTLGGTVTDLSFVRNESRINNPSFAVEFEVTMNYRVDDDAPGTRV